LFLFVNAHHKQHSPPLEDLRRDWT